MSSGLGAAAGKEGRRAFPEQRAHRTLGETGQLLGRAQARHLKWGCLLLASNRRASCLVLERTLKGQALSLGALPILPGNQPEPSARGDSLEEDEGCSAPGTCPP